MVNPRAKIPAQPPSHAPARTSARGGSRAAITRAAARLFLTYGFDRVSMDMLAEEAGVARRTLYNQFASKEEIFRAMLSGLSGQLADALPPGIEDAGTPEEVLRRTGWAVLNFQSSPDFVALLRMVVADTRQFPWIADAFASVLQPYLDRFTCYLTRQSGQGVLDCPHPLLAAHQFLGLLNGPTLWPRVLHQEEVAVPLEDVLADAVEIFLRRHLITNK